jgi:hypothetical protein
VLDDGKQRQTTASIAGRETANENRKESRLYVLRKKANPRENQLAMMNFKIQQPNPISAIIKDIRVPPHPPGTQLAELITHIPISAIYNPTRKQTPAPIFYIVESHSE